MGPIGLWNAKLLGPISGLECTLNNYDIVGLSPADFDGDGGMDLLILAQPLDSDDRDYVFDAFVLWGDHNQAENKHKIMCPEMSLKKSRTFSNSFFLLIDMFVTFPSDWHHELQMSSEPLILDANGDDIADLFGSEVEVSSKNSSSKRLLWLFGPDREQGPEIIDLTEGEEEVGSNFWVVNIDFYF